MKIEDYVHEYYFIARFRAAYQGRVEPFPDRTQWPVVDLGFKICPPLLERPLGRPRVQRIRSYLEGKVNKKKVKCKRCGDFGHFTKTCKFAKVDSDGEIGGRSQNKRLVTHSQIISCAFCNEPSANHYTMQETARR
jgi:hypothetical protein